MKLDGLDHPKTLDLCARLDASLPQVVGHLELLWAFVATKTPQGNVGKWPNGAIARGAHWQGDPEVFVNALVDAGFLDQDSRHRLLVHDWKQHCPSWVTSKLQRHNGPGFIEPEYQDGSADACADGSADGSADKSVVSTDASADSARAVPTPRHATPSHAKPSHGDARGAQSGKQKNRGSQIPEDFTPNETCRKLAIDNGISLADELPQFIDHWLAKGETKRDWQAAFRTWLRNAKKYSKRKSSSTGDQTLDDILERAR